MTNSYIFDDFLVVNLKPSLYRDVQRTWEATKARSSQPMLCIAVTVHGGKDFESKPNHSHILNRSIVWPTTLSRRWQEQFCCNRDGTVDGTCKEQRLEVFLSASKWISQQCSNPLLQVLNLAYEQLRFGSHWMSHPTNKMQRFNLLWFQIMFHLYFMNKMYAILC